MTPEITYSGDTNLNGIVALDTHRLLAVRTLDGKLFRIDLDPQAPQGRTITAIPGTRNPRCRRPADRRKPARRRQLRRPQPAHPRRDTRTATAAGKIEDPSFRSPSTVAKADGRYLVVNADFSKSRSPFTVSSVAA